MTLEENETHINFDYSGDTVTIYTTRFGVRNGIFRRVGEDNVETTVSHDQDGKAYAWNIVIPMDHCRRAEFVTKIVKDDDK